MAKEQDTKKVSETKDMGTVKIADDVIATIIGLAATEVEGVNSLSGNLTNEVIGKLGIKNNTKGLKANVENNEIKIDLNMTVEYGYSVPSITKEVQDKVTTAVESMLGLSVAAINLHVNGVNMENA